MKQMHQTAERLRGDSPYYFLTMPRPSVHIISTCKFCGSVCSLGVCTKCKSAVVCSWCGRVRVDENHWSPLMLSDRKNVSHGMCCDCVKISLAQIGIAWDKDIPHQFDVESLTVRKISMRRSHGERMVVWQKEKERRAASICSR